RHIAAAAEEIAAAMADEIDALARDRLADLHLRLEPAESTAESRANEGERTLRQQNDAAYLVAFRELATAAAKKGGSFRREFAPKGEELSEVGVGPPTACPDIRGLDDDAAAEAMVKWFWEKTSRTPRTRHRGPKVRTSISGAALTRRATSSKMP